MIIRRITRRSVAETGWSHRCGKRRMVQTVFRATSDKHSFLLSNKQRRWSRGSTLALVRSEMRRMLLGLRFAGIYVLLLSDTRVRIAYDSPANIQTSGGTGPMLRHLSLKKIAARKLRVLMSVVALLIFVTMLEVARSP